jgi:DNA-binding GntR family transcriptional regulator
VPTVTRVIKRRPGGAIYQQIAAALREQILSGRLGPGQAVPSERTLAGEYGVTRETARRAHALLRAEGLVDAPPGHALVVREQTELSDLVPPAGATVTARMPTAEERAELDIPDGVPVLWVVRDDGTAQAYPADRWRLRWPA